MRSGRVSIPATMAATTKGDASAETVSPDWLFAERS